MNTLASASAGINEPLADAHPRIRRIPGIPRSIPSLSLVSPTPRRKRSATASPTGGRQAMQANSPRLSGNKHPRRCQGLSTHDPPYAEQRPRRTEREHARITSPRRPVDGTRQDRIGIRGHFKTTPRPQRIRWNGTPITSRASALRAQGSRASQPPHVLKKKTRTACRCPTNNFCSRGGSDAAGEQARHANQRPAATVRWGPWEQACKARAGPTNDRSRRLFDPGGRGRAGLLRLGMTVRERLSASAWVIRTPWF